MSPQYPMELKKLKCLSNRHKKTLFKFYEISKFKNAINKVYYKELKICCLTFRTRNLAINQGFL